MRVLKVVVVALALCAAPAAAWADQDQLAHTTIVKRANPTTVQTDSTFWTPASGKAIVLMGCIFSSLESPGTIQLEVSNTDVIPPIVFPTIGTVVVGFGNSPIAMLDNDDVITLTTTTDASASFSILCVGHELRLLN